MKTVVTEEQAKHYQNEGWLIVEDFLSAEEVKTVNGAIDACIEQMGDEMFTGEMAGKTKRRTDDYYQNIFFQKVNLWRINEVIRNLFINPDLGKMLCTLAGIDGIRVFHDQLLQKPAWGNPTSWHLDNPNWSFHSYDAITIWTALNDVTIQNGCMYYLPGSHKVAEFERKGEFSPNVGAIFDQYPELRDTEPVPIVMKAGSVAFHNGMTAHAAGPNMTPYARRAMTCAYLPEGAVYSGVQNVLTDEYVEKLKIGDVLDNNEELPLVWSKNQLASSVA